MNKQIEVLEAIADFTNNAAQNQAEIYVSVCSCGALTMGAYGVVGEISFKQENAPFIKSTSDIVMCNCNHCVNDWGVDCDTEEE